MKNIYSVKYGKLLFPQMKHSCISVSGTESDQCTPVKEVRDWRNLLQGLKNCFRKESSIIVIFCAVNNCQKETFANNILRSFSLICYISVYVSIINIYYLCFDSNIRDRSSYVYLSKDMNINFGLFLFIYILQILYNFIYILRFANNVLSKIHWSLIFFRLLLTVHVFSDCTFLSFSFPS